MSRLLGLAISLLTLSGACRRAPDRPAVADTIPHHEAPNSPDSVRADARSDSQAHGFANDSAQDQANLFIEGGPRRWFGETRPRVRTALGEPARVESRPDTSQADSLHLDSLVTFHYKGATFVFYTLDGFHDDELVSVTITGASFLKASPLPLGATVAQVRSYFGDSSQGSTPLLRYTSYGGIQNDLELSFEDDRLVKLQWYYGLD